MLLKQILEEIREQKQKGFIQPLYKTYCFSNIPSAVLSLFGVQTTRNQLTEIIEKTGVKKPKKIILFLIDGLGFNQWLKYSDKLELLRRFNKKGIVVPITSVFPSTTAAALNTINSGLTPQEHGLLEWWVYYSELDKMIAPLLFVEVGHDRQETLLQEGVDPKIVFNNKTIYEILRENKIDSFTFAPKAYLESVYTNLTAKGSVKIGFEDFNDLVVKLQKEVKQAVSNSYFYIYYDKIDAVAHAYGPYSQRCQEELENLSDLMIKKFLLNFDKKTADETLILITADHGQISVEPKETIYLSDDPKIVESLKISKNGKKILPWGSARDIYLMVKEENLDSTLEYLKNLLKDKALVMKSEEVLKQGLFGQGKLHNKFKDRIGNIIIIPQKNYTIWFEHFPGRKFSLLGMHGGLTEGEAIVPLAIAKLSELL